jgi:hypothetical protein
VSAIGLYPKDGTVPADDDTDGTWWGGMHRGVNGNTSNDGAPVVLNVGRSEAGVLGAPINGQLVYTAHDYGPDLYQQPWFNSSTCYTSGCAGDSLVDLWYENWGYVTDDIDPISSGPYPWDNTGSHPEYTGYSAAPLFLGEFGTGHSASDIQDTTAGSQGQWFSAIVELIRDSSDHVADGTELSASGKAINDLSWAYWSYNGNDSYGLATTDFDAIEHPDKVAALCAIQSAGCSGPVCDDGTCSGGEDCITCQSDCGACATCSDGTCDAGEDCNSCQSDCGACPPPACDADGVCESGEDCNNCADCDGVTTGKPSNRYCCGDGTPQPAEGDGSICDGNY